MGAQNHGRKKLFSYSSFVTLFIFAIAVMPVLEFSWFAYNHELRQSVKKEQLQIAEGLQKRKGVSGILCAAINLILQRATQAQTSG
jgi:hypothetical protein